MATKEFSTLDATLQKMRGTDSPKVLRDLMLRNCGYPVESLAITDTLKNDTLTAVYSAFQRAGWLNTSSLNAVITQTLQHLAVVIPETIPTHRQFVRLESARDFKPSSVIHNLDGINCTPIAEGQEIPASGLGISIKQTAGLTTYATIVGLSRDAVFNSGGAILPSIIAGLVNAAYQIERDLIVAVLNTSGISATSGGTDNLTGLLDAWHGQSILEPRFIACAPSAQLNLATKINQAGLNLVVVPMKGLTNSYMLPSREMSPLALLTLANDDRPKVDTDTKFSSDGTCVRVLHDVEPILLINNDIVAVGA
jgi:hypothetical protein